MKRLLCLLLSFVLMFFSAFFVSAENSKEVSVSAQAFVIYCPDNGSVLLSRNLNTRMGMASTTKIMTSLLALEYAQKKDKTVEFTTSMQAEGSSMYLKKGDKVRLSDLASGMMTVSGNDAANAAAVGVAGNAEKFSELMNKRAKEIGMKNTCFKNPSGLSEEGHFSTPYDMALLMAEAMENKAFRELTSKKSVTVDFVKPEGHKVTYNNHNRLLNMYEYCVGGKTGYTKASGRCLVTCSEKDNLRLIAVTFNASKDWKDHMNLYEYAFERLGAVKVGSREDIFNVKVMGSCKEQIKASYKESRKFVSDADVAANSETKIYISPVVFAPVKKGDIIGKTVCISDGKVLMENNIVALEEAPYLKTSLLLRFLRSLFK